MQRKWIILNVICNVLIMIFASPSMISLSANDVDVVNLYHMGKDQQTEFGVALGATPEEVKAVFGDPSAAHRSMGHHFYTYLHSGREIEVCFYRGKMVMLGSTLNSKQTKSDVISILNQKADKDNTHCLGYLLRESGVFNESYTRLDFLFDDNHRLTSYQLYNGLYLLEG